MATLTVCASCGRNTEPGTPLFVGRRRLDEGRYLCGDCARAGKDPEAAWPDIPITMPNTNGPRSR